VRYLYPVAMHTINIFPDKKSANLLPGQTILEASLALNIPHAHACGGNARCSSCRVIVTEGQDQLPPRNEKEVRLAEKLGFGPHIRLACQTAPISDIAVRRAILDDIDMELLASDFKAGSKGLGEEREVTLLFADIADYTSLTENSLPYDVVHMLNRYYYSMGNVIQKHQGRIMDYFGDGFLAIFGMEGEGDHALNAVRAGWDMQLEMETLCPYFENLFGHKVHVRIGVNTGPAIIGSIGIRGMQKLAAIGDSVNMASRIEAANKELGTRFLIAQSTRDAIENNITTSDAFSIEVKGKEGKHIVYEVLEVVMD
jgi:adenylate cyclase